MGDLFTNNIGHFGSIDGTYDSYKQAADYAAEAQCWANVAKNGVGDLTDLINQVKDLTDKIDNYERQADMVYSYPELKAYIGPYKTVLMTKKEHHGMWELNQGTPLPAKSLDGVVALQATDGRQWIRSINDGILRMDWWYREETDSQDWSLTANRAARYLDVTGQEWWASPVPTTPAGWMLQGPGGVRVCKTQIKLSLIKNSVDFNGMLLDFRGAAKGTECIRVQYSNYAARLANLRITGDQTAEKDLTGLAVYYGAAGDLYGIPVTQLYVDNIAVHKFNKGIAFGNNAYIQEWNHINIMNCGTSIWTKRTIDKDGKITFQAGNAGEKIIFYKSTIASGNCYMDTRHNLWFDNCSFDYAGYGTFQEQLANQDGALFVIYGTYVDYRDCHFEWGNKNCRNWRPIFRTFEGGGVYIRNGQWHSVATRLNNKTDVTVPANHPDKNDTTPYQYVEYFHQDDSEYKDGYCYIDGFKLVQVDLRKGWSNSKNFSIKNIIAPGQINMYREMYVGDNVSALGNPSWGDVHTFQLNNVFIGNGIASGSGDASEFATLSNNLRSDMLTLRNTRETDTDKGFITATTKTGVDPNKVINIFIRANPKDFCTSSVKVEGLTGASTSGVISVSMSYGMYLLSDDGMHIYTSKPQSWPITTTQGGSTITLDENNTEGLLGHRRISGVNQAPYGTYPPVRPAEYLPTSADYTTYIRLSISLANLVGTPDNPASIKITPLIQKIENIYDRNWHASN